MNLSINPYDQLCKSCIGDLEGFEWHHAECEKCLNKDLVAFIMDIATKNLKIEKEGKNDLQKM